MPTNHDEKRCGSCAHLKPRSDFNRNSATKDGLRHDCRICQGAQRLVDATARTLKMKNSKFRGIHSGLSSVARKVYEAVPKQETWDMKMICAEVKRIFPSIGDQRLIMGCVNTLVHSGLVDEPSKGSFIRASIDPPVSIISSLINPIKQEKVEKMKDATPLEKINSLQQIAARISKDVKSLTDAIETVALEVEEQFSASKQESMKLKQLQEILKSLA